MDKKQKSDRSKKLFLRKKRAVGKTVFLTVGVLLTLNAAAAVFVSKMNIGIAGTFLLGAIFLSCGLFWNTLVPKIPKWPRILFLAGVAFVTFFSLFLLIYGASEQVHYREDAVIVLGSSIKGEELSVGLKERLNRAVLYYQKNPTAVIVVSGGQGPRETVTESLAMEQYLISRGIPREQIVREEKADNTYENFAYAKQLLDERFDRPYSVAFITSEYHVFRAESIAKAVGFDEASGCGSRTKWYALIPSCLRECVGVFRFWILGY